MTHVDRLPGNQLFLAVQTVAELRYGVLVAGWGEARQARLEAAIATTTVVPITDTLVAQVAVLRFECRRLGHPISGKVHHGDLWVAAAAVHLQAHLVTGDRVFDDVPGLTLA